MRLFECGEKLVGRTARTDASYGIYASKSIPDPGRAHIGGVGRQGPRVPRLYHLSDDIDAVENLATAVRSSIVQTVGRPRPDGGIAAQRRCAR